VQKRRPVGTLYQRLEGGYQSWLGDGKDVWLIETYVTDPQSILSSGRRTLAQAYRRLAVKTKLVPGLLHILESHEKFANFKIVFSRPGKS